MCGLFGTTLTSEHISLARKARDTLYHRGPNQEGEHIIDDVYMGHRRLSILDLSEAGRQPMISDDQKIAITVNGEIYNFQILREELQQAGFSFRSTSDSEVILHGYRHWGIEGLTQRIDGMYVAVIYDSHMKNLHVIRDRYGIKPLFYYYDGHDFSWASELKALQAWLPDSKKTLDNTALYDFLIYRYIPPPKTCYKNIFKLPAAHILTFSTADKMLRVSRYWQLCLSNSAESDDDLAEKLVSLIDKSVREQLMSDVPVGFFLSGGIDSSIIAYHASQASGKVRAFTIGFDDKSHDETAYAQIVAKHLKIDQEVLILSENETHDIFKKSREWYDEPFSDTSALPTFKVCELARKFVTVSLSGDGGDELFGGYKWYAGFNKYRKAQKYFPLGSGRGWPLQKLPLISSYQRLTIRNPIELYLAFRSAIPPQMRPQYRKKLEIASDYDDLWHFRKFWRPELGHHKSLQYLDFNTYLPNNIFTKIDRLSMAVSLEARVPFLSKNLVEFAFSLPERFLYKDQQLKGGLKYAYRKILPVEIIMRDKKGFSMPPLSWKQKCLKENAETYQEAILIHFLEKFGKIA